MKKTVIVYGSTTGTTEMVAGEIHHKLPEAELKDVSAITPEELEQYDVLLLGSSTWGLGDLQDDWSSVADKMAELNLNGKKVGFFGTGDQNSYPDTFVDAMGILKELMKE